MVDLHSFLAGSVFPLAVVPSELVFAVVAAASAAVGVFCYCCFCLFFSSACLIWYFDFEVAGLCSLPVALTN